MPELLNRGLLRRLRLLAPLFAGALSLYGLPVRCLAQTVPANLRACAAESDPTRRLACYDREMARLTPSPAQRAVEPAPPAPPTPPAPPAPAYTASPAPAPAPAPVATPATPNPPPPTAPAVAEAPAPTTASRLKRIFASSGSWHETAHVASLDRSPDAMVVHLDNGQVWQQAGRASGDLSLQVGDSITIEKHLGSYWLSSRYISNMKVRQQQ
ncbi:MAG TPA: hypothetical protein VGG96_03235 [Steroidobacteraceae bacterium]